MTVSDRQPRLLDLFCGAGGAAMGYARAGFEVVGVDIEPQPDYPFGFLQADALQWAGYMLDSDVYDAVHASPPCQHYTTMSQRWAKAREACPDLIADTRKALVATGLPYVIENVLGAKQELVHPFQLAGAQFGLGVDRPRLFETNFPVMLPPPRRAPGLPVYGKLDGRRLFTRKDGTELRAASSLEEARAAMGIDWMEWDELREAIPPAYTEHIGTFLMVHLKSQKAAA